MHCHRNLTVPVISTVISRNLKCASLGAAAADDGFGCGRAKTLNLGYTGCAESPSRGRLSDAALQHLNCRLDRLRDRGGGAQGARILVDWKLRGHATHYRLL